MCDWNLWVCIKVKLCYSLVIFPVQQVLPLLL